MWCGVVVVVWCGSGVEVVWCWCCMVWCGVVWCGDSGGGGDGVVVVIDDS